MNDSRANDRRQFWSGCGIVLAIYLSLAGIRYFTPDDLGYRDQERPASYIADIVQNGSWLCQRDATGGISSKPPMHPWLGAIASHAMGGLVRPAWMFPSMLSMLIASLTVYVVGRRRLGWEAALLAATTFLLCQIGPKMVGIVRTDALFGCIVLLNALAALRIWETGRGWTLFWMIAVINTMTKGPLGVILSFVPLLAVWWERGSGPPNPFDRRMLPGMLVWAAASIGWLLGAWWAFGDEVIREVIGRELLRHAALGDAGEPAITRVYAAPFYLLTRYAPWSLFTVAAIIRVIRRPAPDPSRRRFERFLVCWVLVGVVIFALVGHQRSNLIFPLVPASAWLAGGVMSGMRWFRGPRRALATACLLAITLVPLFGVIYGLLYPREPLVRMGVAAREMARDLREKVGPGFPLLHASAPLGFQVQLGVWSRYGTERIACDLLRGPNPFFAAVGDSVGSEGRFLEWCRESGTTLYVLRRWEDESTDRWFGIVGNRERLDWYDPMTGWMAPFAITLRSVRPAGGKSYYLDKTGNLRNGGAFRIEDRGGGLTIVNTSDRRATIRLDLRQGARRWREEHAIDGGGELSLAWPGSTPSVSRRIFAEGDPAAPFDVR